MKNLSILLIASLTAPLAAQQLLPYQNPDLSPHERAVDLCQRMTLEEKSLVMLDESPAVSRLGVANFNWWSEALHGVANMGNVTVYPEPIGMAASFNDQLVGQLFSQVSDEARAAYNVWRAEGHPDTRFHSLSVWTPNVNIFRDPRWGRGQETYGEDPWLTSRMGVQVVRGLQGPDSTRYRKLYACAKHYAIHSGPEWGRHVDNINNVSPRDLWETYMPAFKACVQEGDVREVMCAYQRWDDEPCCGNTRLLQKILRDDWGFRYMVVSDCGAVTDFWTTHKSSSDAPHAAARATMAGTDVECGYDYGYKHLPEAVAAGLIDEKEVDLHVVRLLEGRFELGEMDLNLGVLDQKALDERIVWNRLGRETLNCKAHRQMALEMARQSVVLLQNKGNILPLKRGKIALIGPNADNETLMWGNYNGTPNQTSTLLEGIQQMVGKGRVKSFSACDLVNDQELHSFFDQCSIDGRKGMRGTFWNNSKWEGEPVTTLHLDRPLNVSTYGNYAFAPGVNLTGFSAYYETVFRPQQSCTVLLDVEGCGGFEVLVDGKSTAKQHIWRNTDTRTLIEAKAGEEYHIEIRYDEVPTWNANLRMEIGQELPVDYDRILQQLRGYETVIFAGGISARLEGEEMPIDLPGFKGGDRTDIELPAVQRRLLEVLHEAGKKVVFVCFSGSAIALEPETRHCDAILQAWYPGEEGGKALAEVLYGEVNPSGKLPVTFYRSQSQLPDFQDYSMQGRTYRYMTEQPLFPFGYGLSYTSFQIEEGQLATVDGTLQLTATVRNTGSRTGTEVLQVYIRRVDDQQGPQRSLRAFQRVTLHPGQSQVVTLPLTQQQLETFDPSTNTMRVLPGHYEVYYGNASSTDHLRCLDVEL